MITRLHGMWQVLSSSYWFVPALFGVGAFVLSILTLAIDRAIDAEQLIDIALIPVVQSEGARSVLTTVASSMITVGGVVFSLTLLVLTQASSQFGPRLLVNFMRDRTNQVVLGAFVATFVYALLVLRLVTGGASDIGVDPFVPQISVVVAIAMTFFTVATLVYFFHHTAESVRVTHVLADVGRALDRMLERYDEIDPAESPRSDESTLPEHFRDDAGVVYARQGGYLQEVQIAALVGIAAERNAVIRLLPPVGAYVLRAAPLAEVHPETATDAVGDHLNATLIFGEDRSVTQDPGFLFDEFLEIALRALSPSMNDPFTARSCIDRIGQGILLLDRRRLPRQVHADDDGVVRAFVPIQGKSVVARHLFTELRLASIGNYMVVHHLVTTLETLRHEIGDPGTRHAVEDALEAIVEDNEGALLERDHARLRAQVARFDEPEPLDIRGPKTTSKRVDAPEPKP
ncbi:hypothetical protein BH23DEI1_BH23DEI1_18260 [soil metagenome]